MFDTNEELRRLKLLHNLSTPDIADLLTSHNWGGPSLSTVSAWLARAHSNKMPPNSLDLLILRLEANGYYE